VTPFVPESLALSLELRILLGVALLAGWLGGEAAVLSRAGLRSRQISLPTALLHALRERSWRTGEDRGSGAAILLAFYAWGFASFGGASLGWAELPWFGFYLGLVVGALGLGLRLWAISVLGRHFSVVVRTSAEQTLVRSGPYRRVRHPSYTGLLGIALGLPLVLLSGVGLVVALLLLPLVLGYRIQVEEVALQRRFGAAYEEYRRTSWRLVPWVY
jgi:protein-S-isoprenylcysteine O-methyltransferase Ste14